MPSTNPVTHTTAFDLAPICASSKRMVLLMCSAGFSSSTEELCASFSCTQTPAEPHLVLIWPMNLVWASSGLNGIKSSILCENQCARRSHCPAKLWRAHSKGLLPTLVTQRVSSLARGLRCSRNFRLQDTPKNSCEDPRSRFKDEPKGQGVQPLVLPYDKST